MTAAAGARERLRPQAITFDFYGTLMNSKKTEIEAFAQIIRWNGCPEDDAERFYDRWLLHCQTAYWGRYQTYRRICEDALAQTFADYDCAGRAADIAYYFDCYRHIAPWPDTEPVLRELSQRYPLGIVTNCDDDLFALTPRPNVPFRYIATAQRAGGYKPDGTLFRYAMREMGLSAGTFLHVGQSQRTDLIGGKPLGMTIVWMNRHRLRRHDDVPAPDYEFFDLYALRDLIA